MAYYINWILNLIS